MARVSIPSFGHREAGRRYRLRPSAYVIVRDRAGRIAAVRTPGGVYLPGGGIAAGESPRQAAEREAQEECGLLVRASGGIGMADEHLYASREDLYVTKRSWFFRVVPVGSGPAVERDHELVWLRAASAADAMSHASHGWAIARDGETPAAAAGGSVQVVPYDEQWPRTFGEERDELAGALGPGGLAIHHIGSTSIPGLCAKPVIDILVEVLDLETIDLLTPRVEDLGYIGKGEYGIPGRRYFSRPAGPRPRVHVHAFAAGDGQIGRHLRFRDYLRAHPGAAEHYGSLKRALALRHRDDAEAYQSAKAGFIAGIDARAASGAG